MKKILSIIAVLCAMSFMLVGCEMPVTMPFAEADADQTSLLINKKGGVTQIIVESFEQNYYNVDELRNEIESKASQYCQQAGNEEAVVLKDLTLSEEKQIKVKIQFASYNDYTNFNEKMLFIGSVSEAYQAGYSFVDMKGVDGSMLSAQALLEKGDMHIVMLEEGQQIKLPSKIAYYSDGISQIDEKTAINLNEGQIAFVVYE